MQQVCVMDFVSLQIITIILIGMYAIYEYM